MNHPLPASLLGLRPLDRIQVCSRKSIADLRMDTQLYGIKNPELPFLYFQRIKPDGTLEARAPGGAVIDLHPADIVDVIYGEPVIVRAMPKKNFLARLSLLPDERKQADDALYHPAHVLWVSVSRWGHIEPRVWFLDESLNAPDSHQFIPLIHDDDRALLAAKAKRTIMPVYKHGASTNPSADTGIKAAQNAAANVVKTFIRAVVSGQAEAVEALANYGVAPVSQARMNRLMKFAPR